MKPTRIYSNQCVQDIVRVEFKTNFSVFAGGEKIYGEGHAWVFDGCLEYESGMVLVTSEDQKENIQPIAINNIPSMVQISWVLGPSRDPSIAKILRTF